MSAAALDTLSIVRKLTDAGFERDKAEAVADAVGGAMADTVATKADVEVAAEKLRADMLKAAIGIVFANAGLTFAIIKMVSTGG
ncbi:MAG: hypothetical protein F4X35_09180 [Alphaproteobacteria bacterium]|nr:hypothetical protein [Alphaproteobacteria bacterium]